MRAELVATIPVQQVTVFAEVAWMERRPELGLVCRAASDHGGRLLPPTVQAVLPGVTHTGAANILDWCRMLGLLDGAGELTTLGEEVARTNEAPVPEQGVYSMWIARHPVIGRRILAIDRRRSGRDLPPDQLVPLAFEPERNVVFRSVVDPRTRFILRDLPENRCVVARTKSTCHLRWTLDFRAGREQWALDGTIESREGMTRMKHDPEVGGLDLRQLEQTWGEGPLAKFGRWIPTTRSLAVPFTDLMAAEQDNFLKSARVGQVEVPGFGSYDDVVIDDVPIAPACPEDARRWALARLLRHLTSNPEYRSQASVREVFSMLTRDTPLEPFEPAFPQHDELERELAALRNPAIYWTVVAPIDLAPPPRSAVGRGAP